MPTIEFVYIGENIVETLSVLVAGYDGVFCYLPTPKMAIIAHGFFDLDRVRALWKRLRRLPGFYAKTVTGTVDDYRSHIEYFAEHPPLFVLPSGFRDRVVASYCIGVLTDPDVPTRERKLACRHIKVGIAYDDGEHGNFGVPLIHIKLK